MSTQPRPPSALEKLTGRGDGWDDRECDQPPGSHYSRQNGAGGQDPSPTPWRAGKGGVPAPWGPHAQNLKQQHKDRLGDKAETRLTTFSPNHVICGVDFAWSPRRLFTEHMLPRRESSPRDADGHESQASVGGELHLGGGFFRAHFLCFLAVT